MEGAAYERVGVLYHGANFNEALDIPSSKACAQRCYENVQCNFWWWASSGHCALKQSVDYATYAIDGYVSGKKPC